MGAYRSIPDQTKTAEVGESKRLTYAALGMCGWRKFMEDAHIAKPELNETMSLFAVFDGHGGSEVAHFAQRHLPELLLANANFPKQRYEEALADTFQALDTLMKTEEGEKEIKAIKKAQIDKQNSHEDEDFSSAGEPPRIFRLHCRGLPRHRNRHLRRQRRRQQVRRRGRRDGRSHEPRP